MKKMARTLFLLAILCGITLPLLLGQSGIVNSQGNRQDGAQRLQIVGADASGSAPSGSPILNGGYDGANVQTLRTGTAATLASLTGTLVVSPVAIDPCGSSGIAKNSVAVNISSATTTKVITESGSTVIYVCGFVVTTTGVTTATTVQLISGTGATCGTGTVTLTGTFAQSLLTSAIVVVANSSSSVLKPSAAGAALCLVSAGTTPSIQGYITFVQI